jgi:hypothetical protein
MQKMKYPTTGYPTTGYKNLHADTVLINESGFYSLILGSDMPKAKQFKRWVIEEVLPSIRKTGSYSINKTQKVREIEDIDMSKLLLDNTVKLLSDEFNCNNKDFTGENVMYFASVGIIDERHVFEFGESSVYSGKTGRESQHKSNTNLPCFQPIAVFPCANSTVCEGIFREMIKKTNFIYKYKSYTELFTVNTKEELLELKKQMKDICDKNMKNMISNLESRHQIELEKIRLSNELELEKLKLKIATNKDFIMQLLKDHNITFEQKIQLMNNFQTQM